MKRVPLRGAGARKNFIQGLISQTQREGAVRVTLNDRGAKPAELASAAEAAGLIVRVEGMTVYLARKPVAPKPAESTPSSQLVEKRRFRISQPIRAD